MIFDTAVSESERERPYGPGEGTAICSCSVRKCKCLSTHVYTFVSTVCQSEASAVRLLAVLLDHNVLHVHHCKGQD